MVWVVRNLSWLTTVRKYSFLTSSSQVLPSCVFSVDYSDRFVAMNCMHSMHCIHTEMKICFNKTLKCMSAFSILLFEWYICYSQLLLLISFPYNDIQSMIYVMCTVEWKLTKKLTHTATLHNYSCDVRTWLCTIKVSHFNAILTEEKFFQYKLSSTNLYA